MKTATGTMRTAELLGLLRRHYISEPGQPEGDGGVFAHEVSVNGHAGESRRADALYAGFTSASGRILVGHELKVSKADWRHELSKVGKADTWADACHCFYVVAPSTDVVPPEELPQGWGLMLPPRTSRGRRMHIAVKAAVKADHDPPWWAVRSLMARADTLGRAERADQIASQVAAQVQLYQQRTEAVQNFTQMTARDRQRLFTLEHLETELGAEITSGRSVLEDNRVSVADMARGVRIAAMLNSGRLSAPAVQQDVAEVQQAARLLGEALPTMLALMTGVQEKAS